MTKVDDNDDDDDTSCFNLFITFKKLYNSDKTTLVKTFFTTIKKLSIGLRISQISINFETGVENCVPWPITLGT